MTGQGAGYGFSSSTISDAWTNPNAGSSSAAGVNLSGVNSENVLDYLKNSHNAAANDYYISYLLSKLGEDSAREWNATREDTYYQRLVADLKKAGISPYALTPSGSPINGANAYGHSGTNFSGIAKAESDNKTSRANNQATTQARIIGLMTAMITAIAVALL